MLSLSAYPQDGDDLAVNDVDDLVVVAVFGAKRGRTKSESKNNFFVSGAEVMGVFAEPAYRAPKGPFPTQRSLERALRDVLELLVEVELSLRPDAYRIAHDRFASRAARRSLRNSSTGWPGPSA